MVNAVQTFFIMPIADRAANSVGTANVYGAFSEMCCQARAQTERSAPYRR